MSTVDPVHGGRWISATMTARTAVQLMALQQVGHGECACPWTVMMNSEQYRQIRCRGSPYRSTYKYCNQIDASNACYTSRLIYWWNPCQPRPFHHNYKSSCDGVCSCSRYGDVFHIKDCHYAGHLSATSASIRQHTETQRICFHVSTSRDRSQPSRRKGVWAVCLFCARFQISNNRRWPPFLRAQTQSALWACGGPWMEGCALRICQIWLPYTAHLGIAALCDGWCILSCSRVRSILPHQTALLTASRCSHSLHHHHIVPGRWPVSSCILSPWQRTAGKLDMWWDWAASIIPDARKSHLTIAIQVCA